MRTKRHATARVGVFVASALFLGGCHLVSGGGWIHSAVDGKATFGFTAQCRLETLSDTLAYWFYEGQFQYSDKAAGVRFHADIDPIVGVFPSDTVVSCRTAANELTENASLRGTYRVQPNGGTGSVSITVEDHGEPGPSNGDQICVTLTGGPFDGYTNCGTISGGNIQVQ